jgi:FlaA1/EpsC-like NDP-sugar epimerase
VVVSSDRCYFILDTLRRTVGVEYNVIGFVDSNPVNRGIMSQGVPVIGTTADIQRIVRDYRVETVLILLSADQSLALGELHERLRQFPEVEIKTMPSLVDMIEDRANTMALERRAIHELTGRPPVAIDVRELQRVFGGKRIMVTGAGGSIGSELCRQLARLGPASLVLFERDDSNLFHVERELRMQHPALDLRPYLGDITCDRDVSRVFDEYQPGIVFHAAAYKHVPILEFHPTEAIRVNVLGTHLLARAAVKHGTESFVYISTDKAVNPSSVMGASKRIGEMVVTSMNGLGDVRFLAVRFGNVLDSRGSVSTIFRDAIRERRAITITDPDMKRYFMLTNEAVLLVMQSVALGQGGEVFVLDMGNPVNVKELALAMIRHAGLQPNVDIPIVVTGRRPGEKLFEELFTAEEGTIATSNRNIWRARISRNYCYPDILEDLKIVDSLIRSSFPDERGTKNERTNDEAVRSEIFRLVQNYKPDPSALLMQPTACGASESLVRSSLVRSSNEGTKNEQTKNEAAPVGQK